MLQAGFSIQRPWEKLDQHPTQFELEDKYYSISHGQVAVMDDFRTLNFQSKNNMEYSVTTPVPAGRGDV
jgi:hypothetical protein